MLDLVRYDRHYDGVAAYLLGDVIVVENLNRALELWRETRTTKTLVTLDGEVVDPHGVVTGGSRESSVGRPRAEARDARAGRGRRQAGHRLSGRARAARRAPSRSWRTWGARWSNSAPICAPTRSRPSRSGRIWSAPRTSCAAWRAAGAQLEDEIQRLDRSVEDSERRIADATAALDADIGLSDATEARSAELRTETLALAERLDQVVGELTDVEGCRGAGPGSARPRARDPRAPRQRAPGVPGAASSAWSAPSATRRSRVETLRTEASQLREEAALAQAEAEARAREHGERQSALEERQVSLTQREAALRAARSDVSGLAQTLSRLELRAREVSMKRCGPGRAGGRPLPGRGRWPRWWSTTTCGPPSARRKRPA